MPMGGFNSVENVYHIYPVQNIVHNFFSGGQKNIPDNQSTLEHQ